MSQFTPFTKNTSNIMDTIKEVAADRNLKKGEIDFDLISVQTLIQSTKHKDWTIIDESVETTGTAEYPRVVEAIETRLQECAH